MELVRKVNNGGILTYEEAYELFEKIIMNELTEAQIASILISMKHRKETSYEIAAAATVLMSKMVRFNHDAVGTIDTCGTGGDGKSTINISTAVAINLASLGHLVIKHGNVAQSGKLGLQIYQRCYISLVGLRRMRQRSFFHRGVLYSFLHHFIILS
jgi:Anthranilate phosphoribosyltransferase